jgi:2-methylcitrate dehydratase PrpD
MDVERVEVGVVDIGYLLDSVFPKDCFSTSENIRFLVAYTLRYGGGPRRIAPDSLDDASLKELFKKVEVYVDDEMKRQRPRYMGSVVKIRRKDGKTFTEKCLASRGHPENEFTDEEMKEKFESLTESLIPVESRKTLWTKVMNLEMEDDVGKLLAATLPAHFEKKNTRN